MLIFRLIINNFSNNLFLFDHDFGGSKIYLPATLADVVCGIVLFVVVVVVVVVLVVVVVVGMVVVASRDLVRTYCTKTRFG